MGTLEVKLEVERRLDEVLGQLERQSTPTNDLQKDMFREAVGAAANGLFALALTRADLVHAANVSEKPWGNSKPEDLAALTLADLRIQLEWLKQSRLQETPIFRPGYPPIAGFAASPDSRQRGV